MDDARSIAGGRSIWGLPKQPARFDRDPHHTSVFVDNDEAFAITHHTKAHCFRVPFLAPFMSMMDGRTAFTLGRGTSRISLANADIQIHDAAPFHWLKDCRMIGTIEQRDLRLHVPPPRILSDS